MIFSGLSAWATTQPPFGEVLDYNKRTTYICLLIAFGGTWGGIIVGSTIMYVNSIAASTWYREVWIISCSPARIVLMVSNIVDVNVDAVAGCVHPHSISVSILRHGGFDFLRCYRCVSMLGNNTLLSHKERPLRPSSRCLALTRRSREHCWRCASIKPRHNVVRVLVDSDVSVTAKCV